MVCNKCNSETPENSKFCQVCGNEINPLGNVVPITNDADNYNQKNNTESVNKQQTIQNNNNSGLKIVSILLGLIGIVAMFFHSTIASIIFIIGIIVGAVYKSKTKNKCFGLTLNIIGLILNIIFFWVAVLIVNNTLNDIRKSAECAEKGGYWEKGKCIGAIVEKNEETTVDEETLKSIHFPIMRNSVYDINTYYSLDKFTISNMSNNDILYNAFMDIYEGNMTSSNIKGSCTNVAKQFNVDYLELRIKNILGKNVKYNLESFYVPEDSTSNYKGTWVYDGSYARFIYNGLCSSKSTNTKYYNLEELISAKYDGSDIILNYYVGFAKVVDNNYVIYSDTNMTKEIHSGTFISLDDLNNIFKSINKKDKKIYKYTFKNTLCSYNEYCLYEGKWVNEV